VRALWNWAITVPFLVSFGLVLLVFDVADRLMLPFSMTAFEYVMGGLQRALVAVFQLFGTRIAVHRSPRVQPHTGYVIISNHQSMLDIALIGGYLFTNLPKYVAKAELGKWIPSVSLNLKRGGHALIDRADAIQALAEIRDFGKRVQDRNRSAVIFPEGSRSRDGTLQPFKRSGARVLLEAADHLPVVPVAIQGSWRLNRMWPFEPGGVEMWIGDPMPRTPGDAADRLREAHEWIRHRIGSDDAG